MIDLVKGTRKARGAREVQHRVISVFFFGRKALQKVSAEKAHVEGSGQLGSGSRAGGRRRLQQG